MKRSEYLYGVGPEAWKDLPYTQALITRKFLAKKLVDKLLKEPHKTRDIYRIKEIHEAIHFNEKLLKEIGIERITDTEKDIDIFKTEGGICSKNSNGQ